MESGVPLPGDVLNIAGLDVSLFDSGVLHADVITADQGTVLFSPGDQCDAFLILVKGSIRVELTSRSGRDILLYRMKEKQTCTLTTSAIINNKKYYAQGLADTDIEAIAIPTQYFTEALVISKAFSQFVMRDYASRISSLIGLIDRMASRDVSSQICDLLLEENDGDLTIKMTQEQIAKEIGSAREVVSRKLSLLEADGLISRKRGKIILNDLLGIKLRSRT